MLPCGFDLLCEPVGKSSEVTILTDGRGAAALGAGEVLTGGVVIIPGNDTTGVFSHALKVKASAKAETTNLYFMFFSLVGNAGCRLFRRFAGEMFFVTFSVGAGLVDHAIAMVGRGIERI